MPIINRGGHFLLTEVVIETISQNLLTEAVTFNVTATVNTPIFRGGHVIENCLSYWAEQNNAHIREQTLTQSLSLPQISLRSRRSSLRSSHAPSLCSSQATGPYSALLRPGRTRRKGRPRQLTDAAMEHSRRTRPRRAAAG